MRKELEILIIGTLVAYYRIPLSILRLTNYVKKKYSRGSYHRVHDTVYRLERENIIYLKNIASSKIVYLNLKNNLTVDILCELDNFIKSKMIAKYLNFRLIIDELFELNNESIHSISLFFPEINIKINRLELLIIIKTPFELFEKYSKIINRLSLLHDIRIDYLILEESKFYDLLRKSDLNPVKEILYDKTTIINSNSFWDLVIKALYDLEDIELKYNSDNILQTHPLEFTEIDIQYNMMRFGYSELGSKIVEGKLLCIEYLISSILMRENIRWKEAIPLLLNKNQSTLDYTILKFLLSKYNLTKQFSNIVKKYKNYYNYIQD